MARILINRVLLAALQWECHGPGFGPSLGIVHGQLISQGVRIRECKSFHYPKSVACGRVADRNAGKEVGGLYDKCVAFPVSSRISHPRANPCIRMCTVVHRNDARLVDHLVTKDDVTWTLHNLVPRVVTVGQHRSHQTASDAAIPKAFIFPGIVAAPGCACTGASS